MKTYNIQELQAEFNTLNSIDEQYEFWETRIGVPYFEHCDYLQQDRYMDLKAFIINPSSIPQTQHLNSKALADFAARYGHSGNSYLYWGDLFKFSPLKDTPQNAKDLIAYFELQLESGFNEQQLAQQQLDKIQSIIETIENYSGSNQKKLYSHQSFLDSINDYNKGIIEPTYLNLEFNLDRLLGGYYGFQLSKYHAYLQTKVSPNIGACKTRKHTSLPQQLLVLEYMGILKDLRGQMSDTKVATVLSLLLNKTPQNIRALLPNLIDNQLKSNSSKEFLSEFASTLTDVKLLDASNKIKKDLDRPMKAKL